MNFGILPMRFMNFVNLMNVTKIQLDELGIKIPYVRR